MCDFPIKSLDWKEKPLSAGAEGSERFFWPIPLTVHSQGHDALKQVVIELEPECKF